MGDAIDVRIRCCATISTEDDAFKALQRGAVDAYFISGNNVSPHFPLMEITVLPYIFQGAAHVRKIRDGGIADALDDRLMDKSGMAEHLIKIATSLVGAYRGSLGLARVIAYAFFAALNGSGPAATAAIGSVAIPPMSKEGYSRRYAGAVAASAGALGSLIPPSNLMVIYALAAEVAIPRMFFAGVIPGIFTVLTCEIACLTPPVGGNLLIGARPDARGRGGHDGDAVDVAFILRERCAPMHRAAGLRGDVGHSGAFPPFGDAARDRLAERLLMDCAPAGPRCA
jgi:hypothetical protein